MSKEDPLLDLVGERPASVYYPRVGHFSRWLLEMYGPQAYREAFRASPYDGGPEALVVLEQVYGQPIDTLVATYLDDAPELWLPYFQCEGVERLEPGPEADSWRFESEFDCDDEATFGPWERSWAGSTDVEYRMYQSFLIEIETPGEYRFAREQDNTNIRLERCFEVAGGDEDQLDPLGFQQGLFATLQGYTDVELSPGTYRVDVLREVQPAHTVSVTIAPTPEP